MVNIPLPLIGFSLLAHQLMHRRGMIIGSVLVSRWFRF